ncbi:MAG: J domain-containing protein [Ferruginibacter sp.]
MEFMDYYKILGISKTASQDDIKKAYRKLARQHHPDANPNADSNKKFQQINEANEVLSDPEKRKKFDKYGKDWQHSEAYEQQAQRQRQSQGQYGSKGGYGGEFDFGEGGFSDFFSSMFGGSGRQQSQRRKGQDVNATLQLNLTEAFKTEKKTFSINGRNIRITIPAGIENEQVIKLKGYGSPGGNGGPAGDLYITIAINNNTGFRRTGSDLHKTLEIDLYTALLGGDVTLETLHGNLKLKVKPETQNHTKTRVKGKGFPVYKSEGNFGDLFITFSVKLPTNLTAEETRLFEELAKLRPVVH